MKAVWNDEIVAESDGTREVGGYVYFPRDAVKMALLCASPKTASDHACPHGVQFYDLVRGGATSPRAAWSYEKPREKMAAVDHWVGFWEDVRVG